MTHTCIHIWNDHDDWSECIDGGAVILPPLAPARSLPRLRDCERLLAELAAPTPEADAVTDADVQAMEDAAVDAAQLRGEVRKGRWPR